MLFAQGLKRIASKSLVSCKQSVLSRNASGLVSNFDMAVKSLPMREAVRYTNGNVKVTAEDMKKYADSQANALHEYGFSSGDSIAIWMKESMEKHVTLLAAAKLGLKVVELDTSITSVDDVRAALKISDCKSIIFDPIGDTSDNIKLLRKAIPEFFYYDDTMGTPFHSKYYPSLKYFIHTGFDIELGCLNYKHVFLPDPETNYAASIKLDDNILLLYFD